ncbi:YqaJ viral recombinase family protein [Mesotoga sp.]
MKISTKKMSYEEWKEQRRKGIGGSDAAAIIGLNKWEVSYQGLSRKDR